MTSVLHEELQQGVIQIVPLIATTYFLSAFVVIKPNKVRLILDCRPINIFIREQSFKLNDWAGLRHMIPPGYFGVVIDLSSAFHSLGLSPDLANYLNFRYDGVCYRYVGLPFGLRSAPRLFCAAMAASVNAIREQWDVVASAYMDDLLLLAADPHQLSITVWEIVEFLEQLGWSVNRKKSVFVPNTQFVYLGLDWDTVAMTVRVTKEKNKTLKKEVKRVVKMVRSGQEVRVRELAKFIGQLSATRPQHEEASLYLAKMNRLKATWVGANGWEARGKLTRDLLPELAWWRRQLHHNTANSIRPFSPNTVVHTDASGTGWGATVRRKPLKAQWLWGWWTEKEAAEVNCMRELAAIVAALRKGLQKRLVKVGDDIIIFTDNTNCSYNINRKRAGWRMRQAVKRLMVWLKQNNMRVRCEHIPGEQNVTADSLSRLSASGDYSLRPGVLDRIQTALGVSAEVDLFASNHNRQCRLYATAETTKQQDTDVIARNAWTIPWSNWTALIHPPIPLIIRCLTKIRLERATAIVITPHWRGASWTHAMKQLTVKGPIVLGKSQDLLQPGPGMQMQPPGLLSCVLVCGSQENRQDSE
jgi:hypothetical protein